MRLQTKRIILAMPFHGHGQCLVPETGFGKQRARRRLMGHPTLSRWRGRGLLLGMTKGDMTVEFFLTYLGNIQCPIVNVYVEFNHKFLNLKKLQQLQHSHIE